MTLRNKVAVGAAGIGAAVLLGAGAAPALAYPPETPEPSPSQETTTVSSGATIPNTGGTGLLPVALGLGALGVGGGLIAMSRSRRTDG